VKEKNRINKGFGCLIVDVNERLN